MQTIADARQTHLEGKFYNQYQESWQTAEPMRFGTWQFDGLVVSGGLVRGQPTTEVPAPKATGGITLTSHPINNDTHGLRVVHARYGSQQKHTNFFELEFVCRNDCLSTPIQWHFKSKIAENAEAPAFPETATEGICHVEDDRLVMETAGTRTVKKLQSPYTHQYCLMEALSLAAPTDETVFSQIYDETAILAKQILSPFCEGVITTGGHRLFVRALSLTGPGTLPMLLVCNEYGQLIYTQNGFELYGLQSIRAK